MKKRIWIFIFFAVVLIVALPFSIDWLIIGNNVRSNISNSDWVGFLCEYIGAIIGSIVSMVGIIFTIRFTKEQIETTKAQYEEQKRINVIPVLDCRVYLDGENNIDKEYISIDSEYVLDKRNIVIPQEVILDIYNVGVGAALNLSYGIELNDVVQDGLFWRDEIRTIQKDNVYTEKLKVYLPIEASDKFVLLIKYNDVLGNKYIKRIKFICKIIDFDKYNFEYLAQDNGVLCEDDKERFLVICPRERHINRDNINDIRC